MGYEIRRVRPDAWETVRDIRLIALADTPSAFASTLERETGYDEQRWRQWIAGIACFLAWDGDQPVGVAGALLLDNGEWHVVSMWASPQARGTGAAGQLIEAAVGYMRAEGAREVTLWVTEGNDRARAFYERSGFRATGKRQRVRPGEPLMEQEMSLAVGG
ncbi:MAG TPA: GNAT family N-acetyltransferase [Streptosporangiaceae bacterium]|jgi:ribosomal protein S18 acetylase RimI-like enzyme